MQRRLGSAMRIGRRIGLEDEKGYKLPVFIALIVVIIAVAGFYYFASLPPEEYNTMYLLDSQGMAIDYPEVLVAGQNSTFSVGVNVVNHMNSEQTYQVRTKIVEHFLLTSKGVEAIPVNTYEITLKSSATSENIVMVTENTVGNYVVVFELWRLDGSYVFTYNYCVLDIAVIN